MRASPWALTAVAALAVALAGCPKPDTTPEDAGVDAGVVISPVEMCDRISTARCGLIQRCYSAFARESEADCRSLEKSRCLAEYTRLKPSFEAKKVEIDAEKILSCEQRMQTSACVPSFPPGYGGGVAAPFSDCRIGTGLLRGKVPSGETCDEAVECAQGSVCVKPGGVCKGTCSSYSQEDEPCGFGCAEGLYCDGMGTSKDPSDDRCKKAKGLNEACQSSGECQADLWCDKVCKQRGSVNDPCQFDPQRLSTCAPGLACDVAPYFSGLGTCVVPQQQGGSCRFHWSCAPGLVCYDLDWSTFPDSPPPSPGTCTPTVPVDGPCAFTPYSFFLGDVCAAGSTCNPDGTCGVRPTLGEACSPFTQSCSGQEVYCKPSESGADTGTCTGPANLNDRCATRLSSGQAVQIPCSSGYCDTETTLKCLPPDKALGEECASDGECLSGRCAVQEDRTRRCADACL